MSPRRSSITAMLRWLRPGAPRPSPAQRWAWRHGVALTERSAPYVEAYLRNARSLRLVCGLGAIALAASFAAGTGIGIGSFNIVWVLSGYLAGSIWAELSFARVPSATATRVASLVPRSPDLYLSRRLRVAQLVVTLAAAVLALTVLGTLRAVLLPEDWSRFEAQNYHVEIVLSAMWCSVSLAATAFAQRRIVRRSQPRSDTDLLEADDAMRASAVHQLGVTHVMLCVLLAASSFPFSAWLLRIWAPIDGLLSVSGIVRTVPRAAVAVAVAATIGSLVLWVFRPSPPSQAGSRRAERPGTSAAETPTDDPATGPGVASASTWRAPQNPHLVAATVIAGLCLSMLGLRWWGPLNPDVSVVAVLSNAPVPDGDGPPTGQVVVVIENRSSGRLVIEDVSLVNGPPVLMGEVALLSTGEPTPVGSFQSIGVRGRSSVALAVQVTASACPDDSYLANAQSYGSVVSVVVRTEAGRTLTVLGSPDAQISIPCRYDLPTGPQPEDPAAAEAAIRATFDRVYDGRDDPTGKAPYAEQWEGGDRLGVEAAAAGRRFNAGGFRAIITAVRFDRPDHAWVVYAWHAVSPSGAVQPTPSATRRGDVVLVDGTWRITRSTLCADFALVGVRC